MTAEFFQLTAHQPQALTHSIGFTEARSRTPPRGGPSRSFALTISSAAGNDHERVQHERLALSLGMTKAEVLDVLADRVEPPAFEEDRALAHRIALDFVRDIGRGFAPLARRLAELIEPVVAVGVVLSASRYLAHAAASNTWELHAPVASPLGPSKVAS